MNFFRLEELGRKLSIMASDMVISWPHGMPFDHKIFTDQLMSTPEYSEIVEMYNSDHSSKKAVSFTLNRVLDTVFLYCKKKGRKEARRTFIPGYAEEHNHGVIKMEDLLGEENLKIIKELDSLGKCEDEEEFAKKLDSLRNKEIKISLDQVLDKIVEMPHSGAGVEVEKSDNNDKTENEVIVEGYPNTSTSYYNAPAMITAEQAIASTPLGSTLFEQVNTNVGNQQKKTSSKKKTSTKAAAATSAPASVPTPVPAV